MLRSCPARKRTTRAIELSEKKTRNGRSPRALLLQFFRRKFTMKRSSAGNRIRKNLIKEQKNRCRKTAANRSFCIGHFSFWQQYIRVCFTDAQPEPQASVLWGFGKNSSTSKTASCHEDTACRFANEYLSFERQTKRFTRLPKYSIIQTLSVRIGGRI